MYSGCVVSGNLDILSYLDWCLDRFVGIEVLFMRILGYLRLVLEL